MIEVRIGNTWRVTSLELARLLAQLYLKTHDEDAVEPLFHGVTLFELLKEEKP